VLAKEKLFIFPRFSIELREFAYIRKPFIWLPVRAKQQIAFDPIFFHRENGNANNSLIV